MKVTFRQRGDFSKTERFLYHIAKVDLLEILNRYGQMGVMALADSTPKKTGVTAESWSYEIIQREGYISLRWLNSDNDTHGSPIAILLQYGHATRGGGYVHGIDYINPTMEPIFDQILEEVWKEVTKND